jgi:GntR family transcriptional regulator/MocR family aminotransferase
MTAARQAWTSWRWPRCSSPAGMTGTCAACARCGVLIDFLARHAAGVRLTGLAAGFHAVAHLPESADEQEVVTAAGQRSVGLYGMGPQRAATAAAPPQLVLGFGNVSERAVESGIAAVADLLR